MKKINILQFICPTGFYGAERWVIALAKNLDAQNFNCELAVTKEPDQKPLEIVERYRDLKLPVHELFAAGRFDFKAISKLVALIKERKIDVIHTHGYKSDILGIIAAKKAGIKSVCTPHGFENAADFKLRTFIWLGCQTFRFFDYVVPLSEQLMTEVKKYGIASKRLKYIQNGVDLSEVEESKVLGLTRESAGEGPKKVIGFIGQMISRKNIFELLDIFDEIWSERQDVCLQLLGDGDQRQALESYAKGLKSKGDIEFLGFVDNRLDYLRNFHLFVMTSTLEGIPRCLMETMAMGIPVAAYEIAGIDQLLENNVSGLMAPLGDKQALKRSWLQILDDKTLADALVARASEFVYQNFAASRMAREYEVLFAELSNENTEFHEPAK